MQKITPFLWFDGNAEEAANFYCSIFKNAKFIALNGGAQFKFSPAISLFVKCQTQEEVDHLWEKLSEGGKEIQCGWLTDKFGVTWQIVPDGLLKMLQDKDPQKSTRVMKAMMQMIKLDIAALRRAYDEP
jgi:predicted 3-demethylubiquinone-9 3-methyltransferase (glyoxalase superfamily)